MGEREKAAIEIYKQYATATESLSDRRRGYTAMLVPIQAALLVFPYFIEGPFGRRKIALVILSALIGVVVSAFWGTLSKRYRRTSVFRYAMLAVMEVYLQRCSQIPNFARVYSFETVALYSTAPTFSPSKVETRAALVFTMMFMLNPVIFLAAANGFPSAKFFIDAFFGLLVAGVIALAIWDLMNDVEVTISEKWLVDAASRNFYLGTPYNELLDGLKQDVRKVLENKESGDFDVDDAVLNERLIQFLQLSSERQTWPPQGWLMLRFERFRARWAGFLSGLCIRCGRCFRGAFKVLVAIWQGRG